MPCKMAGTRFKMQPFWKLIGLFTSSMTGSRAAATPTPSRETTMAVTQIARSRDDPPYRDPSPVGRRRRASPQPSDDIHAIIPEHNEVHLFSLSSRH